MNIVAEVKKNKVELVTLRRYFHQHPELSLQEEQTLSFIGKKLSEYGIPYKNIAKGGILARIDGKGPGQTLLLRADVDALPIQEGAQNLSQKRVCISQNPGVMHACGHDGHMAMQLIAAKILKQYQTEWDGTVVLMFERGEEESGPLAYLLQYLETQSPLQIDACYATHVRWDIPAGRVAVCKEAPMAGGFGFKIRIKGHGGHGSRPDLAESPIDCFHDFYSNMQALRMRTVPPREGLTFSIGSLHSGDVLNVIPNELTFAGTCRFFSYEKAGKRFFTEFQRLLKMACTAYDCTYDILHLPDPLFEVQNNPVCASLAEKAVKKYLGEDTLYSCQPWMASETFAITSRLYPGVLTFTGIENKEKGCGANHHTPEFDLDEEGLVSGVVTCLGFTLDYLKEKPTIPFQRPNEPLAKLVERNI